VAGLPEDKLPEVIISNESVPPTVNTASLAQRLRTAWVANMGEDRVVNKPTLGMGAEDFPFFTVDPEIASVYWAVGGTPQADFDAAKSGGPPVPSHHSPLFKIEPESSVTAGTESTVIALLELMGDVAD
ncbi:MAG: amidohydrolase, partial [Pseudomonadota bacterium]